MVGPNIMEVRFLYGIELKVLFFINEVSLFIGVEISERIGSVDMFFDCQTSKPSSNESIRR